MVDMESVRADFDRIAQSPGVAWDTNAAYHAKLLAQLSARFESALDIGCGTGAFTRLLAERSADVTGIDVSEEMIRVARERSATTITYKVGDLFTLPLEGNHFDVVAAIAMLHHVDLATGLSRMKALLRPGGILVLLDLFHAETVTDYVVGAAAFPVSGILRLIHTGSVRQSPTVRVVWDAHAKHDKLSTLKEIRAVAARVLPGVVVRRHLLWRYSLVWRKPVA